MSMYQIEGLHDQRLLVFIEGEDGQFRQVLLSDAQFKKVSDAIVVDTPEDEQYDLRPGYEVVEVNLNEDHPIPADTFIGMTSVVE